MASAIAWFDTFKRLQQRLIAHAMSERIPVLTRARLTPLTGLPLLAWVEASDSLSLTSATAT